MEAYESYQELFDGKMDDFFDQNDATEQDFVDECQKALLTPFSDDAHFVNNVLAATSYESFVGMIVAAHRKQAAESKEEDKSETVDCKSESKHESAAAMAESKDAPAEHK